jgi:hypothetical protein
MSCPTCPGRRCTSSCSKSSRSAAVLNAGDHPAGTQREHLGAGEARFHPGQVGQRQDLKASLVMAHDIFDEGGQLQAQRVSQILGIKPRVSNDLQDVVRRWRMTMWCIWPITGTMTKRPRSAPVAGEWPTTGMPRRSCRPGCWRS